MTGNPPEETGMEGQAIGFVGGVLAEPPAPWASLRGRLGRFWRLLVGSIVDEIAARRPATDRAAGPADREIDDTVLRRAQHGDHGAFHEIVDHYEGRLRVLAYQLLRDADQMNDALQDTFVKAWRGLPRFRGEAALGTWLYRICYRICLDQLRRQRVRPAGEELADEPADTTDDYAGLALRDQVSAALGRLPAEQRAVLLLVDREGYDYGSVAEALEIPVGTVASRLSLARAAMRRLLGPDLRREAQP
jgi:RNA polymerase sigma-70 factor (ECF subfamily)